MCEYFALCFFNLDITEILQTYTEELCGMFFYEFSNCSSMKSVQNVLTIQNSDKYFKGKRGFYMYL